MEDPDKVTYFALTNSRGKEIPFGIKRRDRVRHMYVIGKTGMGKSTLLENMAIQDIRNGEGMAFIDPHGSTAERVMEYVPAHRVKDVLYFAPFDMEHPVAFNVMEDVGYDKRHLVVSGLLSAFRKIWVDAWSARMEYILSNTLLALLEYDGATLLDVNRMLVSKVFRKKVVENIKDPTVKAFWVEEFATYTDRYTQEATPAIQNKIGQFTNNPLIRNIIGQPNSSFDIRQMMDERKIIIINLSKGKVGEVNATLLGSMLVTKIYLAAMSRADVSAGELAGLPSFYFYVDEFQSFANESFADILSEARKYKLNLLIAHQYIEQMEEEVRDAVFGNVGTTVTFRVGPFDAEVLETIFMPQFTKEDLVNLGFAQVYLTLMIDGVGSQPFSATTMPPFELPPQRCVAEVIENSRTMYARPRAGVEQALVEWQAADPFVPEAPSDKSRAPARRSPTAVARRSNAEAPAPTPAAPLEISIPVPAPAPVARPVSPPASAPVRLPERERPQASVPKPPTPVPVRRPVPPPAPLKPALDGARSLKEALAAVAGVKAAPAPASKPAGAPVPVGPRPLHAPDLKAVLRTIAPEAPAAPRPTTNNEQRTTQPQAPKPPVPQPQKRKPAELPENELRAMLEVKDNDAAR